MTVEPSLQRRYSPSSTCFGCGPANEHGMRIERHDDPQVAGQLVATWQPRPHHAAFEGVLNGGVIGTLLDCHLNWAAAMHLMRERELPGPPGCVTAEYTVRLRRATPTDRPVRLLARVTESAGDRVTVEGELESEGVVTATARGLFVAVGPDHPAFERW